MTDVTHRREALRRLVVFSSAVVAAPLLASACKKEAQSGELTCSDTAALTPDELKMRTEVLGYVDKTPDPAKTCAGCVLFQPPAAAGACGGCTAVKGPIHPQGWCKSFAAKPA